jgi:hypothetical protein
MSKSDAHLVRDFIPIMADSVRKDPKYNGRRQCFLSSALSARGAVEDDPLNLL